MKLTKNQLRKIIKEELEEMTPGADEDNRSIGNKSEEKNQALHSAVFELAKEYDKFKELDKSQYHLGLLQKFIDDFKDKKDPNNSVSELQAFAVVVMAKAFALVSGQN